MNRIRNAVATIAEDEIMNGLNAFYEKEFNFAFKITEDILNICNFGLWKVTPHVQNLKMFC